MNGPRSATWPASSSGRARPAGGCSGEPASSPSPTAGWTRKPPASAPRAWRGPDAAMYKRISIERVERNRLRDGSTVNFWIPGVDRRHLGHGLSPDEVPEFEGDVAYFECMWHRKGPWMGFTIIRRAEPDPLQLELDERRSRFRYVGSSG